MPTRTLARRQQLFGERPCEICKASYVPWYDAQAACSQRCAVRLAWKRGKFANRDRTGQVRGGKKSAQTKRARAIARVAMSMGGPVTDRDYALYRLGWKHCLQTNNGRWLLNKPKAKARMRRRVIAKKVA